MGTVTEERTKVHYPSDVMGELFKSRNPNGVAVLLRVTMCGHLYDAGLTSDVLDEVTCLTCLARLAKQGK